MRAAASRCSVTSTTASSIGRTILEGELARVILHLDDAPVGGAVRPDAVGRMSPRRSSWLIATAAHSSSA